MEKSAKQRLYNFMNGLARRNPGQAEFHQAVYEVAVDIIPFMFGQYKHMTHEFTGVLTGKGLSFGGSRIRAEATGYGCVFINVSSTVPRATTSITAREQILPDLLK